MSPRGVSSLGEGHAQRLESRPAAPWIDLRSDTVTRPTADMLAHMMAAPLGDDTYGDDPSVNALQEAIATALGFEAALFVPSGTQSNLCAILAHCQRGDEYLVGQNAHCYRWEGGGAAVFGSVQPQPLEHQADGTLALAAIETAIKPDDPHFARTRLLALENTLGGRVMPMTYLEAATGLAARHGLQRHLDGARLFNAAVAQAAPPAGPVGQGREARHVHAAPGLAGTPPPGGGGGGKAVAEARRIAAGFDSVSVCFSKGLGAPVGSALCGSLELIARARRIRKTAGGSMRQAGLLAAAAAYALEHHVDRLADDHRRARHLAAGLAEVEALEVTAPDTNMVFVGLRQPDTTRVAALIAHLRQAGILVTGLYSLRFVTHLGIDDDGIERTLAAVRGFFAG